VAQKSSDVDPEIAAAAEGVQILGGGEIERIDVQIPGTDIQHALVRIRKEESTPSRYPRRPGMPVKRPMGTAGGRPHQHPKYR
jgi:16S rRNA (guanine527-N7)-methyltransferase